MPSRPYEAAARDHAAGADGRTPASRRKRVCRWHVALLPREASLRLLCEAPFVLPAATCRTTVLRLPPLDIRRLRVHDPVRGRISRVPELLPRARDRAP